MCEGLCWQQNPNHVAGACLFTPDMQLPWALALPSPLVYPIFGRFEPANLGVCVVAGFIHYKKTCYLELQGGEVLAKSSKMLVFVRGAGSSSQWSSRRGDDEYDLDSKPARDPARGFAERGVQHFTEARVLCLNHS